MSTNRIELARVVDGEPMISVGGMSLLFGVPTAEVEQLGVEHGTAHLPDDWVRRGKRRAKEAKRWGASDAMLDALAYWATKDLDARLTEDAFGTVWAINEGKHS
jgi:hypothetical protein